MLRFFRSIDCKPVLRVPKGMMLNCTNGDVIGSVCSWKLINPRKYKVVGTFKSVCKSDRTWSVLTPPQLLGMLQITISVLRFYIIYR